MLTFDELAKEQFDGLLQRARKLKGLRLREVSSVDRGANQHAKIMLMKREPKPEPLTMSEVGKRAFCLWDIHTDLIALRENCSKGKAITKALKTPLGQELWELARHARVSDVVLKDTAGQGGRRESDTHRTGHGASSNPAAINPHRTVRTDVDPDSVKDRIDAEHGHKAYAKYMAAVQAHVKAGKPLSAAHDAARAADPALWSAAKATPTHMQGL